VPVAVATRGRGHGLDQPRDAQRRHRALLQVQQKTVKNHVNRILTKLGARSRVEAVLIWRRDRVTS
jgi:hypothetical protein